MIIDHIGVVVPSLEKGAERWRLLFGYEKSSEIITNTRQKVRVLFLSKPGSLVIKLLEPSDVSSPVYQFALKGGGLHHICFRCEDMQSTISDLKTKGVRLLVPPQPGEAFRNHEIAFLFADSLNFELIDTTEKETLQAAGLPSPSVSGA